MPNQLDFITESFENLSFLMNGGVVFTTSNYPFYYDSVSNDYNFGYGYNLTANGTSILANYFSPAIIATLNNDIATGVQDLSALNASLPSQDWRPDAQSAMDSFYEATVIPQLTEDLDIDNINLDSLSSGTQIALEDLSYNNTSSIVQDQEGDNILYYNFLGPNLITDLFRFNYTAVAWELAIDTAPPDGGQYEKRTMVDGMEVLGFTVTLDGNDLITSLTNPDSLSNVIAFMELLVTPPQAPLGGSTQAYLSSSPGSAMYQQLVKYTASQGLYVVQNGDTSSSIAAAVQTSNDIFIDSATLIRLNSVFTDTNNLSPGGTLHVPTSVVAVGSAATALPTLPSGETFIFDPTTNGLYTVGASLSGSNANDVFVVGSTEVLSTSLIASISATANAVTFGLDPLSGYAPTITVAYNGGLATINGGPTYNSYTNINVTSGYLSGIYNTTSGSFKFTTSLQLGGLPLAILSNPDGSSAVGIDPTDTFDPVVNFADDGLNGDSVSLSVNGGVAVFNTEIGNGDTAEVASTASLSSTQTDFTFTSTDGLLKVDNLYAFSGSTIYGAITGDNVEFLGITEASILQFATTADPTFKFQNDVTKQIAIVNYGSGGSFNSYSVGKGPDGFMDIEIFRTASDDGAPCYLEGTLITTKRGEIPVEALTIGDNLRTHSGDWCPIKWIGRRSYGSAFARRNPDVVPIRIDAGALAVGVPARDLYVSPLHALFLDGVLVPAQCLVNGVSIRPWPDIEVIQYFHIELDRHDVILAEGAPAETFVDCDSRAMFQNAAEFAALYPGDVPPR